MKENALDDIVSFLRCIVPSVLKFLLLDGFPFSSRLPLAPSIRQSQCDGKRDIPSKPKEAGATKRTHLCGIGMPSLCLTQPPVFSPSRWMPGALRILRRGWPSSYHQEAGNIEIKAYYFLHPKRFILISECVRVNFPTNPPLSLALSKLRSAVQMCPSFLTLELPTKLS